ncbi:MAG: 50S ribosomal protein L6 [Deltaproteobacteria bacterium]|nr:50S ribosomal protein L6 [Deltaproteobacteria bacterium]MBW2446435.1 50S ribosomal protein L6 [Deltaproteobacteria bacterium]
MSRVGNAPVPLPSGVEFKQADGQMQVKGPKGQLARPIPGGIVIDVADGTATLKRPDDSKTARAMHGLVRALLANMVKGVTDGFKRVLEIQGVGYRAEASGKKLNLTLGFSHPVVMEIPDGIKVSVENNTLVTVEGIDKEKVGQFAADVRAFRPPEPYKGKGIRYQGEHVRRKVGKAGAA